MSTLILLALVVALAVAFAVAQAMLRVRGAAADKLRSELEGSRREVQALVDEQASIGAFFRNYSEMLERLAGRPMTRSVAPLLLDQVVKGLEPAQAVVLLIEPEDPNHRLFVAAVHPAGGAITPRTAVASHTGEFGALLRVGEALSREDLLQSSYRNLIGAKDAPSLPGFSLTLGARMAYRERPYGLVSVMNPRRRTQVARQMLWAIAQAGAVAYHNIEAFQRASKDRLTGVENKESILGFLESVLEESQAAGKRMSILLFDIDNFKNYNDTNGHLAGDELLHDLAQLIRRSTRRDDRMGRFGGEEFLLVLPETDSGTAMLVAEKLRAMIAEWPFAHREKQPLKVLSISCGVATFPESGRDGQTLLKLADEALYDAKRGGRNKVLRARSLLVQTGSYGLQRLRPNE